MSELRLRLFGAPQLELGGEVIHLGRRKAMALLAYLAVTRSRHQREALAALLWPESGANAAYSALRNVLWILRQTPVAEVLQSNRSIVELSSKDSFVVDVNRFRQLASTCPSRMHTIAEACPACIPRLEEAVSLYQGHFMDGFSVLNSVRYEDWQFAEGESLRRELTEVLDRMIEYFFDVEDWMSAASYARRWLQIDSLNERSHRQLMKALAAQNKRADALRAYEDCKRVLDTELGLPPEAATDELADEIRAMPSVRETRNAKRHRPVLPAETHPFVGRRDLVDLVEQELTSSARRIVTLVGLGGAGKTSLALNIGRRASERFKDGVYYVPLEELSTEEQVGTAVARATGLTSSREESGTILERLARRFSGQDALVILDAVEGALALVRAIAGALSDASEVRLLATSRTELGLGGETVVPVFGLRCPAPESADDNLAEYDAIRLLRMATRRKGHEDFDSSEDLDGMATVARLVEGFPLGLEMAAGWRPMLSWKEIAERISRNLDFLEHRRSDVSPRHRSFRAVFEQAWELLDPEEDAILSRLTVFSGSFTIRAAEAVSQGSPATLAALANRCLVTRVGADRYRVHELLRQFASEHLNRDRATVQDVQRRHAEYYLDLAADWLDRLHGEDQLMALQEMEIDISDIRRAFLHEAEFGGGSCFATACETMFLYYDMLTLTDAGWTLFDEARERYCQRKDREDQIAGFLTVVAAWFAAYEDLDYADGLIREGIQLLPQRECGSSLQALAHVIAAYSQDAPIGLEGDAAVRRSCQERLEASAAFYESTRNTWGAALTKGAMAAVTASDDARGAEELAYRGLHLHRQLGDKWGESIILFTLARIAEAEGDLELARARYLQSQQLSEPISEELIAVINAVYRRASIAARLGEYDGAEALARQALELSEQAGHPTLAARAKIVLAQAARHRGKAAAARRYLEEALPRFSARIWREEMLTCALLLGNLAMDAGDRGTAEHWYREAALLDDSSAETSQRVAHLRPQTRDGQVARKENAGNE